MEVRKEDFPIIVQAYEMLNNKEIFVAEQVVSNQAEVDIFTARYAGKLIKAKQYSTPGTTGTTTTHKKRSSTGLIILIALILLIVLIAVGFASGWIQRTFNINLLIGSHLNLNALYPTNSTTSTSLS